MLSCRGVLAVLVMVFAVAPAAGQRVAVSPAPDQVGVTVYRAPFRPASERMNLSWLNGFALITETRRVSLPAGEVDLRFEGVAGGILPESAIVTGLPVGIVEKNRDAYLLSPGSLVQASLGKRVSLRRTSRATGAVREQDAIVRSGAEGGVVIETEGGIETLRCTGLAEALAHDRVPAGLSAQPTLSVRVRSDRPVEGSVTLSYLASGFDWQANYVAHLSPDGKSMDLFAWLTLANADETGFRNARTSAVAGRLNRTSEPAIRARAEPLQLQCWPQGSTSDVALQAVNAEDIVVTGARIGGLHAQGLSPPPPPPPPPPAPAPAIMAQQEELGDLKLYHIPEPVTIAAKSQKQVALLQRSGIKVESLYRQRIALGDGSMPPLMRVLSTRNRRLEGLGLPLPSGRLVLFANSGQRPVLIGQGTINDAAVGEDVEIEIGTSGAVTTSLLSLELGDGRSAQSELTVINPHPYPIRYEAEFDAGDRKLISTSKLQTRSGRRVWKATVPPNAKAVLRYRSGS